MLLQMNYLVLTLPPAIQRSYFLFSRLVLDPERFLDDKDEPMADFGMGVIYTKTSDGSLLRDMPQEEERENLIHKYYVPHHRALTNAVEFEIQEGGYTQIIDCHSFPSIPLPYDIRFIFIERYHSGVTLPSGSAILHT